MVEIRSSRSEATVGETYFSGIFCESIRITASDEYTVGSIRTTTTAQAVNRIQANPIRILCFQTVRRIERGIRPGLREEDSSEAV